jgi:hypothetical protein
MAPALFADAVNLSELGKRYQTGIRVILDVFSQALPETAVSRLDSWAQLSDVGEASSYGQPALRRRA